jgi:hypothetical protein
MRARLTQEEVGRKSPQQRHHCVAFFYIKIDKEY